MAIACTGDNFGGWDGVTPGSVDQFITADLQRGRMVDVIKRGEPAVMACHWPGFYYNGQENGFKIFQEVVLRLHAAYQNLVWMKLSEIARYWAAKELTRAERATNAVSFQAPFACPAFTVRVASSQVVPKLQTAGAIVPLQEVPGLLQLRSGTWLRQRGEVTVCFDLAKGVSRLEC